MKPATSRVPRVLTAFAVIAVVTATPAAATQQEPAGDGARTAPDVGAHAAILVDLGSGDVLYSRNAREVRSIASLTKVVTAIVARDRFALDEVVEVGREVDTVRGGKLGLEPGMRMTVNDLLHALLMMSGNDAATALAAHDPLGYDGFIASMNAKARALGASSSSFVNPHGMDEPGHLSTARDMAILARSMLRDQVLAEIVAKRTYPIEWPEGGERVIRNHNKLIGTYPGAFGGKTGFTNQAGRSLIAAAGLDVVTPGGGSERREALTVVLKSADHYADTKALFAYFQTGPRPVGTALQAPRPSAAPGDAGVAAQATVPSSARAARWVLFPMALLAGAMLLTVRPGRRASAIAQAAQLPPSLEPLARDDRSVRPNANGAAHHSGHGAAWVGHSSTGRGEPARRS